MVWIDAFAISMDSPLAKALLGKHVDDEVVITIGEKTTTVVMARDYRAEAGISVGNATQ